MWRSVTYEDAPAWLEREMRANGLDWEPEEHELASVGGHEWGHIVPAHDLAGGQHDWIWLRYENHRRPNGYDLDQHRDAMTRRGRLPAELRFVKVDAERIIVALDLDGASHTAIARVFHVDRKTIRRVIKRRLNVPLSPHVQREERSVLVAEQQPEFIAEVREMHKSLAAMVADVRLAVTELGAAFPHDAAPPVLAPVIDLAAYRQRKEVA